MCCSVLLRVAAYCCMLQRIGVCCSMSHNVRVSHGTESFLCMRMCARVYMYVLHCVAVCTILNVNGTCTLQHNAIHTHTHTCAHCNTMQHIHIHTHVHDTYMALYLCVCEFVYLCVCWGGVRWVGDIHSGKNIRPTRQHVHMSVGVCVWACARVYLCV